MLDARLDEMDLDQGAVLVVPRPAPLRHRAARRLRPRLRADDHLRHRHGQHPRRDPVPAHAGQRRVLIRAKRHGRVRGKSPSPIRSFCHPADRSVILSAAVALISSDRGPESGEVEDDRSESRPVARWFDEIWNERRTDTIEEFLGPESVGHLPGGDMTGAEPFKQLHAEFLAAFPDLKVEVEDSISDGDNVVVRWRATGTHDGDGLGFEATHQSVSFRGITWFRIKDGKFVEGWDSWNQEALVQRLREGSDEQRELTSTCAGVCPPASGQSGRSSSANTAAPSWRGDSTCRPGPGTTTRPASRSPPSSPLHQGDRREPRVVAQREGPQYVGGKPPELPS